MNIRWDVLGFGVVAVDDLVYVDRYPQPGTKVPIRKQRREGGGLAGTALVAASRLGAAAAYCGVLGDDELSRFTIQELEREGVDCAPILRRAEAGPSTRSCSWICQRPNARLSTQTWA
jgi:sugar/nucleoside kinase (ribokinase family)